MNHSVPGNHLSKFNWPHKSKIKIPTKTDNYEQAYQEIIFSSSQCAYNSRIILRVSQEFKFQAWDFLGKNL